MTERIPRVVAIPCADVQRLIGPRWDDEITLRIIELYYVVPGFRIRLVNPVHEKRTTRVKVGCVVRVQPVAT